MRTEQKSQLAVASGQVLWVTECDKAMLSVAVQDWELLPASATVNSSLKVAYFDTAKAIVLLPTTQQYPLCSSSGFGFWC